MKNLVFIFAALLALRTSAQKLNDKGLYMNNDGGLFSGTILSHNNGIKSELTVKEGVISGEAVYYYASGKVMERGAYTDGKKDQKWVRYSENGNVSAIAYYHLGNKNGTWLVYDENGKKRFEMNYTEGAKSGIWTSWDERGEVVSTKDYSKTF